MNIDKMREEFEVWAKRQAESVNYQHMQFVLAKHENGDYRTTWVDMAWLGWQASRESLVIQLPYVSVIFEGADQDNDMVSACREAIEAQGIRTR